MAANLTLSSVAVAANGKTITATISGGSAPYSIASSVGLFPGLTAGELVFHVASVSVSGTTLTINLSNPIGTGETARLSIASNSTLTDSASNTPTGQNNLPITNNSTETVTTFTVATSPEAFEVNYVAALSGGNLRSQTGIIDPADNYPIEFVAHATNVALVGFGNDGAMPSTVRVDGGNETTAASNGFWSIKPLGTGLTADKHLFQTHPGDFFTGVRLAGGNRTMHVVPTTKRTFGPNTQDYVGIPQASPVAVWNTRSRPDPDSGLVMQGAFNDGLVLEFAFTGSGVDIFTIPAQWGVRVDGAQPGRMVTTGYVGNTQALGVLAESLDPGSHQISATVAGLFTNTTHRAVKIINGTRLTAPATNGATTLTVHSTTTLAVGDWIKIDKYADRQHRQITAISGNVLTLNASVAAHPAGASVTSYSAPAGTISAWTRDRSAKRLVSLGDSNTQGFNEAGINEQPDEQGNYFSYYDPRTWPGFLAADPADYEVVNLGVAGSSTAEIAGRRNDLGAFGSNSIDYVTVWAGTNDINPSAGLSTTPAQYKAHVQSILDTVIPKLRPGGRVVLMPPATGGTGSSGGLTIETARQQLVDLAAANPTTVVTPTDLFDDLVVEDYLGLHYAASGRVKVAAALAPYLGIVPPLPAAGFYLGDRLVQLALG